MTLLLSWEWVLSTNPVVNDLPNMHCDRFPRGSIIYEYNIEIFFTFVCFEDELGKFERELKENKSFNS